MTFYYDHQTRSQAESLMEQQHYPVLEDSVSEEDDDWTCDDCGGELDEDLNCIDPDCIMCPDYEKEEDDEA